MPYPVRIFALITLLSFLLSCQSGQSDQTDETSQEAESKEPIAEANDTRRLVQEAQAKINPESNSTVLNSKRAELFAKQALSLSGQQRFFKMLDYANELLRSGQNKKSLEVLDDLQREMQRSNLWDEPVVRSRIKNAKAITYMRIGESENCIQNHNHNSCIVPVADNGVHELKYGSSWAINELTDILKANPQDSKSIWLLNLAHMTLGTFPDGVPEEYRMPDNYFNQNKDVVPVFENIGDKMGIADNRLSGASIFDDFDNDGDLDLIASSWGLNDQVKYYLNNGDGSFTEVGEQKGLKGVVGGLNIVQTDFNNDGFLDLFIMRGAWLEHDGAIPNTLLRNDGKGAFKDVTLSAGLTTHAPTQASSWCDFNLDGHLDLVIVNESLPDVFHPTQLWMNNGDETFSDVGGKSGLVDIGYFKGVATGDLNNDGLPDLYVSNLGSRNLLYIQQPPDHSGIPRFLELGSRAGVIHPFASFPTWIFDFNNDGLNDILVSSYNAETGRPAANFAKNVLGENVGGTTSLYINKGNGKFEDIHESIGMTENMWSMGCNYGDIDNDGWLDFYLGTGDPSFFSLVPNKMFRNVNGKGIQDITYAGRFGHIQKGHGVSMADVDRDGDLDVYVVMGGAFEADGFANAFFQNPGNDNQSVVLQLEGTTANKKAIGARVEIIAMEKGKERSIWRTLSNGSSFGANSLEMEVGLGNAESIKSVKVLWPNKEKTLQEFKNLSSGKAYLLKEGQTDAIEIEYKEITLKLDEHAHHHH